MTLVVARSHNGRVAIAADTLLSEHDVPLPLTAGVVKSCCLPGYLCASFSGSPELAGKAMVAFRNSFPQGTGFAAAVAFFEASSAATGVDYILAFGSTGKLVTIRDGRRTSGVAKTHWIGDKVAYERFRECEHEEKSRHEHQRAVNVAVFADEMTGSPADDLYWGMRNVVLDPRVPTVGGFVTVLSNRDIGFRYSVYSDVLFDWPEALTGDRVLQLTDALDLAASGENDRYSINQISGGYYDQNIVAFYVLKGKLLVLYHGEGNGPPNTCVVIPNIEPSQIAATLNEKLGFDFRAMCLVMSARAGDASSIARTDPAQGLGMPLFCEANTLPKPLPSP